MIDDSEAWRVPARHRHTNSNTDEAVGRIVDWATFMRLRAQRSAIPDEPDNFDTIADCSTTDVELADFLNEDARFSIGLHHCHNLEHEDRMMMAAFATTT